MVLVTLYPFGVGDGNTDTPFFENVEHVNPILARGLDTNIKAVIGVKSIGKAV